MIVVLEAIGLLGLVVVIVWLIGFPGEEDEEELAGFVTANWDEIETWVDRR